MHTFTPEYHEKLLYLWQVAWFSSLQCTQFVYYCIIWYFESSAASIKLLSALDAKNIHYNPSQRASESPSNHRAEFTAIVLFSSAYYIAKTYKAKEDLLENNVEGQVVKHKLVCKGHEQFSRYVEDTLPEISVNPPDCFSRSIF